MRNLPPGQIEDSPLSLAVQGLDNRRQADVCRDSQLRCLQEGEGSQRDLPPLQAELHGFLVRRHQRLPGVEKGGQIEPLGGNGLGQHRLIASQGENPMNLMLRGCQAYTLMIEGADVREGVPFQTARTVRRDVGHDHVVAQLPAAADGRELTASSPEDQYAAHRRAPAVSAAFGRETGRLFLPEWSR